MSRPSRIFALATVTAFALSGCAMDDTDLDDELATAESVELTVDDGKADSIGVKNFKVVGKGDAFVVVGYDGWGREVTRMYGGTDGSSSWATLYGYGTHVSIDLTEKRWGSTRVVAGKVAGSSYSIYSNTGLTSVSKYGTAPKLSKQQATLMQTWQWMVPQVIARTKNDVIKACLAAVAEAIVRVALCVTTGGFWDCIGAVGAVVDAVSSCREAID